MVLAALPAFWQRRVAQGRRSLNYETRLQTRPRLIGSCELCPSGSHRRILLVLAEEDSPVRDKLGAQAPFLAVVPVCRWCQRLREPPRVLSPHLTLR